MKKGLTHIDWAMSIGLFILYLVIIFILFKPGIKEEYTSDFLSSIVQQGITDDSYLKIEKTPIFIEPNILASSGDYHIQIDNIDFWLEGNSSIIDDTYEI